MIHAMRRNAFLGTVVKLVLYALIFVAAPLWLYTSYLAPMLDQLLNTYQQIQGTGAQAQAQLSDLQGFFEQFKNGFSSGE
jgi:hypothetical protein